MSYQRSQSMDCWQVFQCVLRFFLARVEFKAVREHGLQLAGIFFCAAFTIHSLYCFYILFLAGELLEVLQYGSLTGLPECTKIFTLMKLDIMAVHSTAFCRQKYFCLTCSSFSPVVRLDQTRHGFGGFWYKLASVPSSWMKTRVEWAAWNFYALDWPS